jgi:hypothetical protein
VDLYAPLRLPRPAFELLLVRLDEAVPKNAVRLLLHEDVSYRELVITRGDLVDLVDLKVESPEAEVKFLDQVLLFAFENAPDEVIADWASSYDEELVDEAVSRVRFARENMPNLGELWREKSTSVVPPLVGFGFDVVHDKTGRGKSASLYLSAGRVSLFGRPDKSDMTRLRVQLWPDDVVFLVEGLTHMLEEIRSPEGGGGDAR